MSPGNLPDLSPTSDCAHLFTFTAPCCFSRELDVFEIVTKLDSVCRAVSAVPCRWALSKVSYSCLQASAPLPMSLSDPARSHFCYFLLSPLTLSTLCLMSIQVVSTSSSVSRWGIPSNMVRCERGQAGQWLLQEPWAAQRTKAQALGCDLLQHEVIEVLLAEGSLGGERAGISLASLQSVVLHHLLFCFRGGKCRYSSGWVCEGVCSSWFEFFKETGLGLSSLQQPSLSNLLCYLVSCRWLCELGSGSWRTYRRSIDQDLNWEPSRCSQPWVYLGITWEL